MTIIKEPEVPAAGMTLKEMREEVFAQGFDDFEGDAAGEARINRWINQAYQELTLMKDWPFLEAEYEGTLPNTFENLGKILDVVSVTNRYVLRPADRREIVRFDPTLQGNGQTAYRWFQEGVGTIATYPKTTSETFRVRYAVVPSELTEDTSKPLLPRRFQYLIVKGAERQAYMSRDAYSAAELVNGIIKEGRDNMVKALFGTNHDRWKKIITTRGGYGYGGWNYGN